MKTIFGRLMVSFLAILAVSFIALGILLSHFLGGFFSRANTETISNAARGTVSLLDQMVGGKLDKKNFNIQLGRLAIGCGCRIWVENPAGESIAMTDPAIGPPPPLPPGGVDQIFSGQEVLYREGAGGLLRGRGLLVGLPYIYEGVVRYAIVLQTEGEAGGRLLGGTWQQIWMAAGLAACLAVFGAYLLARRLSAPLHEMSLAAADIARGNFKRRVGAEGGDEIGQLATSFNYMAERLDRTEETRREFLGNVSHELRSPLTSVQGFLQGILEGAVPQPEERRYLDLAFGEVRRLSRLVNDLLDLSSIEGGGLQLDCAKDSLSEIIRRTIAVLEPQFLAKGLEPILDLPEKEVEVVADSDRLEQVMFNLLSNAIRFSPVGGTVTVSCRHLPTTAQVEVQDQGPGIGAGDLPHIFERFYKADQARTTAKGGTGLGLAIAWELVKAHGGEIWAENSIGGGAKFLFTIPNAPHAEKGTGSRRHHKA